MNRKDQVTVALKDVVVALKDRNDDTARIRLRQIIRDAENGDYRADYGLRCLLVEYLDYGDYRSRDLPDELRGFMQRALFRDPGQSIKQAIEVVGSAIGREFLIRGLDH